MPEDDLEIGYVSGVFGTSGEVKVYLYNPDSPMFGGPLQCILLDSKGHKAPAMLTVRKGAGKRIIGRFKHVQSRTTAEGLNGFKILVGRSVLPALPSGEFYVRDLESLTVCYEEQRLGLVNTVHSTTQGDILEIHREKEVGFVPLKDEFVSEIDISGGRLVLTSEGAELL